MHEQISIDFQKDFEWNAYFAVSFEKSYPYNYKAYNLTLISFETSLSSLNIFLLTGSLNLDHLSSYVRQSIC